MKKSWLALALAGIALSPAVLAASSQTTTTKETEAEIAALRERLDALETATFSSTRTVGIGTQEVFGIGSDQYNEVLYINDFGINTDLNLLHQRRFVHRYFHGYENAPRVMFSGNAFGNVGSHSHALAVDATQGHQYMQASVELDTVGYANEDWLAYLQLTADAFGTDTDLGVKQGFVTYGNLDKVPVYLTMGYQYIPFGSYTSSFITDPLVLNISRTQVPAMTGGYVFTQEQMNFNASAYWFDGQMQTSDERRLNEWGFNAQLRNEKLGPYKNMAFTVGASWMNNMASSNGIKGAFSTNELKHYVPAGDVRLLYEIGAFTIMGEWVQATQGFSESDVYQTIGDHAPSHVVPEAAHFEASYGFPILEMSTELSIAYDQTEDSLAFGLPEEQYGVSYQLAPYENTYVTFEYMHKFDYDKNTSATIVDNPPTIVGTGAQDDVVQMQVNVYF